MVELLWDQMLPMINLVIEKAPDDLVAETIKSRCVNGHNMAVIVYEEGVILAVNILDVRELDSGMKVLYVPVIGGTRLDEWSAEFMTILKQAAKDYGCEELRGMAVRKGWMTKLKPLGWEEMFTTVRCKIGD